MREDKAATDYASALLKFLPPRRGRKSNIDRDAIIVEFILALQKRGINPTRNQLGKKQRKSGCSIATEILAKKRINVTETAVNKIWQRFSKYQKLRAQERVRNKSA
jgi:hypothetical protein